DGFEFTNKSNASFIPMGEMDKLSSKIYKENKLSNETHQHLLQTFPRNTLIKFSQPPMDKELARQMRKEAKDVDKTLQCVSYRTSSILRPLDNAIRTIYQTKPDPQNEQATETWEYMELSLLATRTLFLDSLLYISEQCEKNAIKCLYPTYQLKSEVEPLFTDKLKDVIKNKNEEAKFFNDALWQNKHAQSFQK
ncbi:23784_t:CDS:1, partial [Dentiscutata erythropus]